MGVELRWGQSSRSCWWWQLHRDVGGAAAFKPLDYIARWELENEVYMSTCVMSTSVNENWDMNGYDSPGISKRASNTSTFLQIFVASDTALNAGQLRRLGPPVDKGSRPKVHCLVECGEKSFWWFLDASARKLDLVHYWYMKNHGKIMKNP